MDAMADDQPPIVLPQTWRVIGDQIPDHAVHLGNGMWMWPSDGPEGEWFIPAAPPDPAPH